MAQVTRITLHDDLDGSDITQHGSMIPFSLDGQRYEIDLSPENEAMLREMLGRYIAAGRKVGKTSRGTGKKSPHITGNKAMREWGRRNGFKVATGGRIPTEVRKAYQDSQRLRSVS